MSFCLDDKSVSYEQFLAGARLAKKIDVYNEKKITALPEAPAATVVRYFNLPLVTALPEAPAATDVWYFNLPLVTKK